MISEPDRFLYRVVQQDYFGYQWGIETKKQEPGVFPGFLVDRLSIGGLQCDLLLLLPVSSSNLSSIFFSS